MAGCFVILAYPHSNDEWPKSIVDLLAEEVAHTRHFQVRQHSEDGVRQHDLADGLFAPLRKWLTLGDSWGVTFLHGRPTAYAAAKRALRD